MSRRPGLELTAVRQGRVLTVRPVGALDFDTGEEFDRYVAEALAENPGTELLRVDCTGIDHVDSMGLSAFLMLRRRLRAREVELRLDRRSAGLDRLLEITGTLDHLAGPSEDGGTAAADTADEAAPRSADNSGAGQFS
ncbi:STAS domain-containing protein [Streptomyces indicus]|uniref:Anti-anti-sigma factor n=1 Tax=Streptomyces indicus TaxID=417292 RepID=A0A1G9BWR1_9ACTN|nr:STAS domain-containing protein [Streptomyces indicus]SDK43886.1 anti-anti-sigma factor [Streptomyces indicus]